jgi:hypothetical protein
MNHHHQNHRTTGHLEDATNRRLETAEELERPTKRRAVLQEKPSLSMILPKGIDNENNVVTFESDAATTAKPTKADDDENVSRDPPAVDQGLPEGPRKKQCRHEGDSLAETNMKYPVQPRQPGSTPFDVWQDQFQNFLFGHGFLGSLLIRGLEGVPTVTGSIHKETPSSKNCHESKGDSSHPPRTRRSKLISGQLDDDDEETTQRNLLSRRDLDSFRYILITESRADKLDAIHVLLFGETQLLPEKEQETAIFYYDQHGSFGRQVYSAWDAFRCNIKIVRCQVQRLDWLVAFTRTIHEFDEWIYDDAEADDDDMDIMVKGLAAFWRRLLLKERDQKVDLGWDTEYTKPAVSELLSQFKTKVEACPALGSFDYVI